MLRLKTWMISGVLLSVLFAGVPTRSASAQELKSVFQNTLWGGAIGGVVGAASWALQDEDKEDKLFSKYMVRGAAIGILGGMLYGFVANASNDPFAQAPGLLNHEGGEWAWHPEALVPHTQWTQNGPRHEVTLLQSSF